jgi:hypothetical protein
MNKKGKIGGMIIGVILGYFVLWLLYLYILSLIIKEPSVIATFILYGPLIGAITGAYLGFKYIPI